MFDCFDVCVDTYIYMLFFFILNVDVVVKILLNVNENYNTF